MSAPDEFTTGEKAGLAAGGLATVLLAVGAVMVLVWWLALISIGLFAFAYYWWVWVPLARRRNRRTVEHAAAEAQADRPVLEVTNAVKAFGGLVAVDDVDFTIPQRSIVSIIGPNGAGKTTFFNMLTGLYKPTAGTLKYYGVDITGERPDIITSYGMARTFQNIRLFATMSALENVMVGQHSRMQAGIFGSILRSPRVRQEEDEAMRKAAEMLEYVGLKRDTFGQLAINLSYGDQRRVEVARALASNPRLLLLDEPTAGMNPQESAQFTEFVHRLRDEKGISVLLIEHDMKVVMGVSERVTVLDHGQKIAEGEPHEVRKNPQVIEAYLGKRESEEQHA